MISLFTSIEYRNLYCTVNWVHNARKTKDSDDDVDNDGIGAR